MRESAHSCRRKQAMRILDQRGLWQDRVLIGASLTAMLLVFVWLYGAALGGLFRAALKNDDYSAGVLVPLVVPIMVWREKGTLRQCRLRPCWWWGAGLIVMSQFSRLFGLLFMFESIDRYSVVPMVAGLVLMLCGWQLFRRVVWILLFLLLMFPLPGRVHNMVSPPLQRLATTGSVFLLEVVGTRVSQQGNVVMLGDNTPMAVAEACSGLRMLTAFIIVAAFIAYMVKRPRWHKAILLASSIPVAVACNIIRIFLTAMIMLYVSVELGEHFFHDFAGLVMMPAAVSLIFGEIWLLDRIVTPDEKESSSPSDANSKSGGHPAVIHARRVAK